MEVQAVSIKNVGKQKSILLRPKNKKIYVDPNKYDSDQLIYTLECLLSREGIYYTQTDDIKYGFSYDDILKHQDSYVVFDNTAKIIAKEGVIDTKGAVPKIHGIRYLKKGNIRSFLSSATENERLTYNMKEYSPYIPKTVYKKIFITVNKFFGKEVVKLKEDKDTKGTYIEFSWLENSDYSVESQKFIYLLIAECFMTPKDYKRVLLFTDIELLNDNQTKDLFICLKNIAGHLLIVSNNSVVKDI